MFSLGLPQAFPRHTLGIPQPFPRFTRGFPYHWLTLLLIFALTSADWEIVRLTQAYPRPTPPLTLFWSLR